MSDSLGLDRVTASNLPQLRHGLKCKGYCPEEKALKRASPRNRKTRGDRKFRGAAEKPSTVRLPEGAERRNRKDTLTSNPSRVRFASENASGVLPFRIFSLLAKALPVNTPRIIAIKRRLSSETAIHQVPGPPLSDAKYILVIKIVKYDGSATHFTIRYCPSTNRNSSFEEADYSPLDRSTSIVKPRSSQELTGCESILLLKISFAGPLSRHRLQ